MFGKYFGQHYFGRRYYGGVLVLPSSIGEPIGTTIAQTAPFYNVANAMWPDLVGGGAFVSPPRNGVNRKTGKMLSGFEHIEQSLEVIFATPFHQRVLRRWVGSFVPHILGRSAVPRVVTRFYWAIATAIDLWEPGYRMKRVYFMGQAVDNNFAQGQIDTADLLRLGGVIFRQEGIWYPRGHLGDFTPASSQNIGLLSKGGQFFDVVPIGKT